MARKVDASILAPAGVFLSTQTHYITAVNTIKSLACDNGMGSLRREGGGRTTKGYSERIVGGEF